MKPIISRISRLLQRPTSAGWTTRAMMIGLVAASLTSCRHVQETTKAPVFDDTPPPVATTLITDTATAEAHHSAPLPELATTSTEDAAPPAEKASATQPTKATKPAKPKASPAKAAAKPVNAAAKPVKTPAKPVIKADQTSKADQPTTVPVETSTPPVETTKAPSETTKASGNTVKALDAQASEAQAPDKDTATVAPIPTTITAPQYSSTNLLQMLTFITTILILLILIGLLFSFLRFKKRILQRLDADEKKAVETNNIAWRALETANANKNQNAPPPTAPTTTNDETTQISNEIANINTAISHLNNKVTKTNVDIANANAELVKTKSELAATEKKLAATEEKLALTEEKLTETEVKLAKTEEKVAEQQATLCQFASTQTSSKKTVSRTINEPDLFAENSLANHEAEQPSNKLQGADANENEGAAPVAGVADAPAATANIDLNEAKESPLKFVNNLSKSYPNFFENLRLKGPSLTNRDLTLCILIALGVSKESILQHFELTAESFKAARYRIRTKLALERRDSLDEFLQQML